ncbi:MAG: acyltransferase family protein [Arenicella sp.]|nr:acyltransferase family protein [Arenicella sp.]
MNSYQTSYRAEIDGLRAIAVVSVVLYHAQLILFGRDWFEGGFIGVDIFFVISGYLITRIILVELESKGSFSFLNFYERRARRILPMLFVVIFVSAPYAWQKLLPSAFVEYAESILASLFFGSNFFFYFSTTEYGADSALLKPFLHTWSLGVEEQFYLVFPILAILAFKYFRKHFLTILVCLSLLSIQFAELMEVRNSDLNFYLPFSRFWELAVGSMLAYRELYYKPSNEGVASKSLPMIGLYLIAYSILFFDGKTLHPSFHTLIPIIGVALIIGFASKDELVGKVLGSKPFVWVGLISYSAYLWHFPIFAFSRVGKEPTNYDKFEWIALTLILSILSYFLVEKPFRARVLFKAKTFIVIILASLVLVSTAAYLVISTDGFVDRFPKSVGFDKYELDNEKLRKQSWTLLRKREKENPNFLNVENKILLVGNSHAKDFYNALVQNGYVNSEMDVLRGGLPQIRCANEKIDSYAPIRNNFYSSRQWIESTTLIISTRYLRGKCKGKDKNQAESNDIDGLAFLIKRAKLDGKRVVVLGNTIEFGKVGNKWVADYVYDLHNDGDAAYWTDEIFSEANRLLWTVRNNVTDKNKKIAAIASKFNVPYFDKVPLVCNNNNKTCAAFTEDGHKISYDYGHWTIDGARFLGKRLAEQGFDNLIN